MNRPGIVFLAVLVVEVLLYLNYSHPTFRFSVTWANGMTEVLFFVLPVVILIIWIRSRLRKSTLTVGGFFATTAVALLTASWLFLGVLYITMSGKYTFKDYLECVDQPVSAHTVFHAFAFPGWGPVREGYVLRHEMTILPGVRLVKEIERGYLGNESTFCEDMKTAIAKRTDLKPYVYL